MNEIPKIQYLGDACCGCSACAAVCPVDAIEMSEDPAGFRYPAVDGDLCIQCQECDATCPSQNPSPTDICREAVWAQCRDDAVLEGSSSGALIPLAASRVVAEGGVVCGAAFVDGCRSVAHILVDSPEGLPRLQGSKYLQSSVDEEDLRYLRRRARDGVPVLFIGTPCQVAGFNNYMGDDAARGNVTSIDVFCHGVPSPTLWRRYCEWLESRLGSRINNVNFRDKETGWQAFSFAAFSEDSVFREGHVDNWFMKAFLTNTSLRPQCYQCTYKRSSGSDLTVGDYWGFDPRAHGCPSWNKGVSAVLANTDCGSTVLQEISTSMLVGPTSFEEIVKGNSALVSSVQPGEYHKEFMTALSRGMDAEQLMQRWPFTRSFSQRAKGKIRSIVKQMLGN